MTNKERVKAILNYEKYDRLPIVHFGFWPETLEKWAQQGHVTSYQAQNWSDSTPIDRQIGDKLGFDFGWYNCFSPDSFINPLFETTILKVHSDGSKEFVQSDGVVVVQKDDVCSIPAEIDHLLKDRSSWQKHYLPRLQFFEQRITKALVNTGQEFIKFEDCGLDYLKDESRENPMGLFCGSLFGNIRNILGVVGVSYLSIDDEELYDEIIDTVADLCYRTVEYTLSQGAKFDFAHFWEDICCKSGPLVNPEVFNRKVGPYYKKITNLLKSYDIDIVSLDCDGLIDSLIPTWFHNGVNTMFPVEVGTWNANIKPWREKYGKELRGVGGMNKTVFSHDYTSIDAEIDRLQPLVELGGYIPCPDHRIAPDAKWENVQYYCDKMKSVFG